MENDQRDVLQTYFGVFTKKETDLNLIFLSLAFPLGINIFYLSGCRFFRRNIITHHLGGIIDFGTTLSRNLVCHCF